MPSDGDSMPLLRSAAMDDQAQTPFDSVEGAQEYIKLLSEALLEARQDVEGDISAEESANFPRRLEALRLVLFKLDKLETHLRASGRLLNDLRMLRRLLLEERGASEPKAR